MGEAKKIKPEIKPIAQEKFEMIKTMIILLHSDDEWVGYRRNYVGGQND